MFRKLKALTALLGLFASTTAFACTDNGGCISEILYDLSGAADDRPREYIEIRATPGTTFPAGTYLVNIEGDHNGNLDGLVDMVFDLSGKSVGTNGYLVFLQAGEPYAESPAPGSITFTGTTNGFGGIPGFSGTDTQIEDGTQTWLLIRSAIAPIAGGNGVGTDIDADNNGAPDGAYTNGTWQILDSIGILDQQGGSGADATYAAFAFGSNGSNNNGTGGPAPFPGLDTPGYVGRAGESTGDTSDDWVQGDNVTATSPPVILSSVPAPPTLNLADLVLNHIGGVNFPLSANLRPVNTVPSPQTTGEDIPYTYTGGTAISFTDDAVASATNIVITLSVTNGTLAFLGPQAGVTAVTAGPAATITATGSVSSLNTFLSGGVRYTPTLDFFGTATVTFTTNDNGNTGLGGPKTDVETGTINVTPTNDPVDAVNDSYNTTEDVVFTTPDVRANDQTGDSPTTVTFTQPANGSVVYNGNGTFTYTPAANTNGNDTFTYTLTDSNTIPPNDTDTATVTLVVAAVNDAPSFVKGADQTRAEDSGTATVLNWATSISDGDPELAQALTFNVSSSNLALFSSGPAVDASGTLTFTPAPNASGSATITISLSDDGSNTPPSANTSASQTFTITITAVNDAPVANDGTLSVTEDTPTTGTLVATDVDSAGLTYSIVSQGTNGTATITNAATGAYTYTPNANATGGDTFTFKANDGALDSNTATIAVTIAAANDAPIAYDGTLSVTEDQGASGTLVATDVDSAGLTYSVVAQGAKGTVTITNAATGAYIYTPNANATGGDTFTFKANDGSVDSNTATITVTIAALNDAPTFVKGADVTRDEDAGATTVLGWATAIDDGDAESVQGLAFEITSNSNAALFSTAPAVAANGDLTFTPAANASGTATVTLRLLDDGSSTPPNVNASATQSFVITINAVNDAPVANDGTLSVTEDTAASGTLVATDVDSATLTYSVVAQGTKGTVTITDAATGAYTYTPNANATGGDTFTFRANDGTVDSNTATITVTITAVDDAPVASDGTLSVTEDTATSGTLVATEFDLQPLAYSIVAQGTKGVVTITNASTGAYTYTPNANATGGDSFTFKASDGTSDSNTATVTVTITAVNDAPVANDGTLSVTEDTPATGTLVATDVDNATLTYSVVAQGAKGTVTITDAATGAYTYTPNLNATGADTFTFKANDGTVDSNTATITVTITAVNDAPVANDGTLSATEDTAASGTLVATDVDSATLAYSVVAQGTKGTVTITDAATGAYTYTPNANATGGDTFTFKANDGSVDSNTATITVTITAVNDAPVANDGTLSVTEDTAASGTLVATDVDTAGLTYSIVAQGTNGTATITNAATGAYTYTPNANATGGDTFTFKANDGTVDSNTATITVTIANVNDNPVANDDSTTVAEDSSATTVNVLANDSFAPDTGETLAVSAVGAAANGTAALNAGVVSYTPNANFQGTDSFTYTISDGNGGTATATVNVTVTNVNDAPVAAADSYTTDEDVALTVPAATGVLANDSDIDPSETLTAILVTDVASGTLALAANGGFTYTPAANFNGPVTFTYKANDGDVDSNTVTVTIGVSPVNDNPVAANDTATVAEDSTANAIDVLANDNDGVDTGETLSVTAVTQGTNGTVAINGTATGVTYTPAANFFGSDSFTYTIGDGNGGSATATVNVTVTNVNDNPVANDDSTTVAEDSSATTVNVLANDSFAPDTGETLAVSAVGAAANGTAALNAGVVSYTPNANFQGTDSFTYTISDGNGGTATATVNVTVTNVNDAPVAAADSYTTDEDVALTVPAATGVLANDSDIDPSETLTAILVTDVASGTLALAANGGFTYTPAANFNGPVTFTYKANDGDVDSNTVTVTIGVSPVNDNPVAANDTATVAEDSTANAIDVLANDNDGVDTGETLSVTAVTQGTNGTVAINGTATGVTYTPAANFFGSDSFTYTIGDGNGGSATATVNVTVTNVNDDPVAANDTATVAEDSTSNAIDVLANDNDGVDTGETLSVTAVTQGANGTVAFTATGVTYTPAANFNGSDSFTYTIGDGNGGTATATVTVTVTGINDAPSFTKGADVVRDEDSGAATIVGWATSISDGDPEIVQSLSFQVTANSNAALFGTAPAVAPNGNLSFTPAANANGTATVSIRLVDNGSSTPPDVNASAVQTFVVTINAVNDAPVAADGTLAATEDQTATGTLAATDVDDTSLTYAIVAQGTKGTATVTDAATGAYSYVPSANATGTDTFTFRANDGDVDSNTATITVTIAALDDDLLDAVDDDASATEAGAVVTGNLLANDLPGDVPATLTAATQGVNPLVVGAPFTTAGNGTLTLQSTGAFSYTPPAQGQVPPAGIVETFVYRITDVDGDTATAIFTITVGDNDVEFPSVVSIVRMDPSPTTSSPVRFRITFTETVNGVGSTDLRLVTTGDVSGHVIDAVSCSNALCVVTVSILDGDGTLGLNLVDDDSIVDLAGFRLGGTGAGNGDFTGEVYTVDLGEAGPTIFPTVDSITRLDPNPNPGPSVRFAVRFSEAVTGVDAADFTRTTTGTLAGGSITGVTGSGQDWIVTVATGTGTGRLGLDLVDDNSIRDATNDPLGGAGTGDGTFLTGAEYDIDTVNGIPIYKDGFEDPAP